jgi:uncharacterized protein YndB with AHSA1/START domain
MVQIPSSHEVAIVSGDFRGFSANALYDHFVDPQLLTAWWPDEALLDPRVAGELVLRWPDMDWTIRGVFTSLERGRHVGFTWNWDHEPSQRERYVDVWLKRS